MNERTQKGLLIVEAALLLGVIGDTLLGQASGLGINLLAWMCALVAVAWWLERITKSKGISRFAQRWLMPTATLFAACVAWRASGVLRALDLIIVGLLLTLVLAESRAPFSMPFAGIVKMMTSAAQGGIQILTGFASLVFADVRWREVVTGNRWSRHAAGIMRGLAIGLPLVLFFGVLFMAADAVFSRLVNDAFRFDGGNILARLSLTLCFTWLAGGFLRNLVSTHVVETKAVTASESASHAATLVSSLAADVAAVAEPASPKTEFNKATAFKFGLTETGIVLGLLNALFAFFVVVQLRYLFGGAERVTVTDGLTYAEYARHGFFELVIVALFVLPMLLGWDALLRRGDVRLERAFRLLAGALVALLFVIMASAVKRMMLYTQEYGLTELRFYTTAFMAWLGLTLIWFVATVIARSERRRFAFGALAAGLLVTFGLHVANPDALIVRVNADLAVKNRVFDAGYASSLSDDAIPALAECLPRLSPRERAWVARHLIERGTANAERDWRAWTVSGAQARKTFATHEEFWRASSAAGATEMNCTSEIAPPSE